MQENRQPEKIPAAYQPWGDAIESKKRFLHYQTECLISASNGVESSLCSPKPDFESEEPRMAKKARRRTVKHKPAPTPEPHRDPDSRVKVEQKLGELRAYYEEGQESLRRSEGKRYVPYGSLTGLTASDAERIRKARVFANVYTLDDLNRLERLCREHGMALGRSLIDRLASVSDKSERQRLEEEAIAGRWSKIILDREIRQRFGDRNPQQLGRKSKPPRSAQEALSDLVRLCVRLTRWAEFVGWDDRKVTGEIWGKDKDGNDVVVDTLPAEISGELQRALRAVSKLQKAAETELKESR